jgi:hypothetical protein
VSGHLPGWVYPAGLAGAVALFFVVRRFTTPALGSGLRPIAPVVLAASAVVEATLTETGHRISWEYVNPLTLAATCPGCGGRLVITTAAEGDPAGGQGTAHVHGSDSLNRDCGPQPEAV